MTRTFPLVVAAGCWSAAASGSVVPPKQDTAVTFRLDEFLPKASMPAATTTTTNVRAGAQEEMNDESSRSSTSMEADGVQDEPWRQKEDWWKDPLALFGDNDEYVESATPKSSASSSKPSKKDEIKPSPNKKPSKEETKSSDYVAYDDDISDEEEQERLAVEQEKLEEQLVAAEKARLAQEMAAKEAAAAAATEQQLKQKQEEERQAQKLAQEVAQANAKRQEEKQRKAEIELRAQEKVKERLAQLQAEHERKALEKAQAKARKEQDKLIRQEEQKERRLNRELERLESRALVRQSASSSKSGTNIAVFPLASLAFLPKISELSLGNLPIAKVLAGMAFGKAMIDTMIRLVRNRSNTIITDDMEQDMDGDDSMMDPTMMDTEQYDSDASDAEPRRHSSSTNNNGNWVVSGLTSVFRGKSGQVLHGGAQTGRRRSRAEELEHFRILAERSQMEKQGMINEYEKASFQLQESRAENANLLSQTKYLKAQVRDYEEMMDRTTRNERKKAKVELQRMKQAMMAAMDKEREAMRKELVREKARLNGVVPPPSSDPDSESTAPASKSSKRRRNNDSTSDNNNP